MTIRTNYRSSAPPAAPVPIADILRARAGKLVLIQCFEYRIRTGRILATGDVTLVDAAGKRHLFPATTVVRAPVVYKEPTK